MLKPEQVEERLKSFAGPRANARRIECLDRLPENLRGIGRTLLKADQAAGPQSGGSAAQSRREQASIVAALARIESLPEGDRSLLFSALCAPIGETVDAAWRLFDRLPYQHGWALKAFRSSNSRATGAGARTAWLSDLLEIIAPYDEDVEWLATWAPYLHYMAPDAIGVLCAAAIARGGEEAERIFRILVDSARSEHEIGAMGRHVTRGLLLASRPEGWEFIERLLLAAQRQEGLRQVILETVDEAHPEAFRRMLRLILDVDPEATASTVEMRAALVRESCRLLKLENVRLKDSHVLIDGQLGCYSIHLGSGVVHKQAGGHLCIVPVHAQHRGRMFLPFADDDPRTAEVLSKVVLLANDKAIKDPTILEQIIGHARTP